MPSELLLASRCLRLGAINILLLLPFRKFPSIDATIQKKGVILSIANRRSTS